MQKRSFLPLFSKVFSLPKNKKMKGTFHRNQKKAAPPLLFFFLSNPWKHGLCGSFHSFSFSKIKEEEGRGRREGGRGFASSFSSSFSFFIEGKGRGGEGGGGGAKMKICRQRKGDLPWHSIFGKWHFWQSRNGLKWGFLCKYYTCRSRKGVDFANITDVRAKNEMDLAVLPKVKIYFWQNRMK